MQSNIEIVRTALKYAEKGNIEAMGEQMADDFAFTGATPQPMNKEQFLELMRAITTAIPDWQFNITNVSGAGDNVRLVNRITGKNTGTFDYQPMGISSVPPTGKSVALPQQTVDMVVRNGKLVAFIVTPTQGGGLMGILTQLGIKVPATSGAR